MKRSLAALVLIAASSAALPAQSPATPAALADELLAVDRAFSAAAGNTNVVDTLLGMFRDDVSMNWPKGFAMGRDEAKAALLSNPANTDARLSWTPLRAGVSADGLHGFTLGVMSMTMPDKTVRPAKYMAYWIKDASGWKVAAYKRAPAGAGPAPTEVWAPSLPSRLVAPVTDAAVIDAHRTSLIAAEKAFSDDAQVIGTGPAFVKWGRDDATNFGDPNSPGYTVGAAAIGGALAGQAQPGPTTIEWSAERALVASSGDLGITFGYIRAKDGSRPPFPFFTIWRRDSPSSPWRYVAE